MASKETEISSNDEFDNDEDIASSSDSQTPWYKVTIFANYNFSQAFQDSTPKATENISGKCSVCKKNISGRRAANSNFKRHFVRLIAITFQKLVVLSFTLSLFYI